MLAKKLLVCFIWCVFLWTCVSAGGESRLLNDSEMKHLRESIRTNYPPLLIDMSCEIWKISPRSTAEQQFESIKAYVEERKLGTGLTFRSTGFFDKDKYIILSHQRIIMKGLSRVRKEITYFSDANKTDISSSRVNIYDNGVFYSIDKKMKKIDISDKPSFESSGIGTYDAPAFGKTAAYMNIADVDGLLKNDSNDKMWLAKTKRRLSYDGRTQVDGIPSDAVTCLNKDMVKERALFLDPNDWGRCNKVVWYNGKGNISETIEFRDFTRIGAGNDIYPLQVIHSYFDELGEEKETVITIVSNVTTNPSINQELFSIREPEFARYDVVDYRFSPPVKSIKVRADRNPGSAD